MLHKSFRIMYPTKFSLPCYNKLEDLKSGDRLNILKCVDSCVINQKH